MAEQFGQVYETLLKQQTLWMEKMAIHQQQWMERLLASNSLTTAAVSHPPSNVPAFPSFDKVSDRWDTFYVRLNQHFEAHNVVDEDQKRAYFLSWVGTATFDLLCKLLGDKDVSKQKYADLVDLLSKHFTAKTHVLAARYEFLRTQMKSMQTYAEWVADLRGIARDCRYICGKPECEQSFVDSLIRDAIVLHTPHDQVRNLALQHVNPTLEDVLRIAEAYEATQNTVKTIKGYGSASSDVNQMSNSYHSKSRGRGKFKLAPNGPDNVKNKVGCKLKSCPGCGVNHSRIDCRYRTVTCRLCKKIGHIDSVCLSKGLSTPRDKLRGCFKSPSTFGTSHKANMESLQVVSVEDIVYVGLTHTDDPKMFIELNINGHAMNFQVDTGATCSMIGLDGYEVLGSPAYTPSMRKLRAYGNTEVPVKGQLQVQVTWESKQMPLPLLVTNTRSSANIFGLDWFQAFGFHISNSTMHLTTTGVAPISEELRKALDRICSNHSTLFEPGMGICNSFKAQLHLKPGAVPKFFKPRPLPFAQMEAVRAESDRLTTAGIWKPVKTSQWAAPIVVVPKSNGSIRICGDFKITVNPQIEVDQYPIPRPEELFHKLQNGKHFSKIDLSDAYLQIELDDASRKLLVVNTSQGLFEYNRLPFGVSSAPAIYQRFLEQLLVGIPGCANYLDDILVTGSTEQEHLNTLDMLFQRLEEKGLRCNKDKCSFFASEVEYLGYRITAKGVRPSDTGIQAIKHLPRPKNAQELQSFMGKVNYYGKFIDGFSQLSAPLNALRKKHAQFYWNTDQEYSFQELKNRIIKATCLVHYNPDYPVILATDASSYGIGAVISHRYPDGSEKPIAFASKTMTDNQRRYSQIEKEGLSIIYGVKKFHQYLYGRKFELQTDHKPLLSIFHPNKQLPVMTAQRLQRWAIILMGYTYDITFRPTEQHCNADALSRLPVGPDDRFDQSYESCCKLDTELTEMVSDFPVDYKKIGKALRSDPLLSKVLTYVLEGWPDQLASGDQNLKPYFDRQCSLSTCHSVLLLQTDFSRVVIPASFRSRILSLLHSGHWGIVRMKQLARRYCWWPGIDKDIADMVALCESCQTSQDSPKREFRSWPEAQEPWERVHIDFAGPFCESMWLICVDAFSRFPYIVEMSSTKTEATVAALKRIFVIEGLPATLVSDNGTQLTAKSFNTFCNSNGIKHITTAPFHPASNGEAERFVRTFKAAMKKACGRGNSKEEALQTMLTTYRTTPSPISGKSPAEFLHGRQPRIPLSLIQPPKNMPDTVGRTSKFGKEDPVYVRNYSTGLKWVPGTVISLVGTMMYLVQTEKGIWKRHQNQMRKRNILNSQGYRPEQVEPFSMLPVGTSEQTACQQESEANQHLVGEREPEGQDISTVPVQQHSPGMPRRSQRIRHPVVRFSP